MGRERVRTVLNDPAAIITMHGADGEDDRVVFLGEDHSGRVLEVMAVPIVGGLLVIHAMDIRAKWKVIYEEGLR